MQEDVSVTKVAIRVGLLLGIIIGVYTIILYITELEQNKVLAWGGVAFLIGAIFIGMKEYRKQNNDFMSYGQGVGLGSLIAAIGGLLSAMFTTFYIRVIDMTPIQRGLDVTRETLEKQGMDDSKIDEALEMAEKFQTPGMMFALGVVGTLVMGLVISLIVAAILQKKRPVFE